MLKYKSGYSYDEFSEMCDQFKTVKLPVFGHYDVNRVLAEYIFGYSMKRFPTSIKNTFRRMIASMFTYNIEVSGNSGVAFIFTGDGKGRPDYIEALDKVVKQADSAIKVVLDRKRLHFRITYIPGLFIELLWALQLNRLIHNFDVCMDMAVSLYRAKKQGESIYLELRKRRVKKVVTFCDLWAIESIITQQANKDRLITATLQHGNGTDILYGSCSKYYLANSKLSRQNCIIAGIPENKIIIAGPMKYAGEVYSYPNAVSMRRIGVVFDGAQNFENNVEMLNVIHDALIGYDGTCCIRFHPNNRRDDYLPYLKDTDIVYDNLAEFEQKIDICVVYNSSMYTDMIYKKIPVYRFKNGKIDLFTELEDRGFSNSDELQKIFQRIQSEPDAVLQEQLGLFNQVFGSECTAVGYREFFENKI